MNRNVLFIIVCFFLIFCNFEAYASRPFSTEDAGVAEKGKIETEIGFEYTKAGNDDDNYAIALAMVYGVTDSITLCAEFPFEIKRPDEEEDEEGVGDIALAAKALIFPETETLPSLLLKTKVKLSNGDEDEGLGSGDEDAGLILVATKSVGQATFHANAGYTFVGDDEDSALNDYLLYGIAIEYSIIEELSVVGEVYMESDSSFDKDAHTINPLMGLTYQLTEKIKLDTAFKMGIRDNHKTEYAIITGATISF